MGETVIKIQGMTCMHCKAAVEKALKAVPGVVAVDVDLALNRAKVEGSADREAMASAVTSAGYAVLGTESHG